MSTIVMYGGHAVLPAPVLLICLLSIANQLAFSLSFPPTLSIAGVGVLWTLLLWAALFCLNYLSIEIDLYFAWDYTVMSNCTALTFVPLGFL